MRGLKFVLPLLLVSGSVALPAQQPNAQEQAAAAAKIKALQASLTPRAGVIPIPAAHAALNLGQDYYFLPADQAKRVLTEGWGNPPDAVENVLGMVFPKGKTFADETWGAVVTFEDSGYVEDTDAQKIDYTELLNNMREGEAEHNEQLRKDGYPGQVLVGWAQQPTYDAAHHSLVWARRIKFDGGAQDTVNYDVRLLGRSGVLSLNMVTVMSDLPAVRPAAQSLATTAQFDSGQRYADFNSATDKKAEYGLAGLIAAGAGVVVAKKLGLLGLALAFGKKFLVLIIAAFGGIGAWFKRTFGRRDADI